MLVLDIVLYNVIKSFKNFVYLYIKININVLHESLLDLQRLPYNEI